MKRISAGRGISLKVTISVGNCQRVSILGGILGKGARLERVIALASIVSAAWVESRNLTPVCHSQPSFPNGVRIHLLLDNVLHSGNLAAWVGPIRVDRGGYVFHVLSRANARMPTTKKQLETAS